ncbi:UDP-3-O-acyl-N-acetylglucosamine deacetylase [Rubinisphaera margarita]|uniref:UDP-3-O-acyl-N-acetylglucosamine deacetylase n=1 Tax=Rubinisphaera margarita TaxID=2909586 RepID=UPI001EE83A44|nr:UDP-3-O-acyl-N-acetylglucosamine deacetylase [Rubinisphaera margarita]MCG6157575.1 UDP-3-O-acyl-N-acetylglucosamine deacetylase [Rubinisphaera margarita]
MPGRFQQTISRSTSVKGFGLFTNADVCVTFQPAGENHGIVFQRVDLPGQPKIKGCITNIAAEERRTKLLEGSASVEMVEHVLAALAGLRIDNCLIQVDAPELPGCDGSALPYAAALLDGEPVQQAARRKMVVLKENSVLEDEDAVITAGPYFSGLRLSYDLNYGADSVIPAQLADFSIDPVTFASSIAGARTFVLEKEIVYLRSRGYGEKVSTSDLLVYGQDGPVDNELRAHNECARHKLLDCLGDLSLCGCDVQGHIRAFRSGHRHNHQLARLVYDLAQKKTSAVERAA